MKSNGKADCEEWNNETNFPMNRNEQLVYVERHETIFRCEYLWIY